MMRVLVFTGGPTRPSSRFRIRQHIPQWRALGLKVYDSGLPFADYPEFARRIPIAKPFVAAANMVCRVPALGASHVAFDVTMFQKPLLAGRCTLEGFARSPRVLDVDDAIWAEGNPSHCERLTPRMDLIIVGNEYLAEYFSRLGGKVCVIPTAVNIHHFRPLSDDLPDPHGTRTIVWTGTWRNLAYLYEIEESLKIVLDSVHGSRLRIIADQPPNFKQISSDRVEYIQWSPDVEAKALRTASVGVMPLRDDVHERGKCAFKMLQYLACGLPVVVSPVGMNAKILAQAAVGLEASCASDWVDCLTLLLRNDQLRAAFGRSGRELVERHYSSDVIARQYIKILHEVTSS